MRWSQIWDSQLNSNSELRVLTSKEASNWIIDGKEPQTQVITVGDPVTGKLEKVSRLFNIVDTFAVFCHALGTLVNKEDNPKLFEDVEKLDVAHSNIVLYYKATEMFLKLCIKSGLKLSDKVEHPISRITDANGVVQKQKVADFAAPWKCMQKAINNL